MEQLAQLGALGFWIFLAAIIVAGIWSESRKRESQQETLRRMVESGKDIDSAIVDKILNSGEDDDRPDEGLKIAGTIVLFIAPGLAVFGWFLSGLDGRLWEIFQGIALLVGFVGAGLYTAGKMAERRYNDKKG
jgi:hypothetical protein